ncbi:hypothetical protein [Streptococcus pluranimalium]|uniref:hypothetical protein n=1 Tax=Streptococcus pluranimalium TaxID=82348 RepID=UPI0039FB9F56
MSKKFTFGIRKTSFGAVSVVLTVLALSLGLSGYVQADDNTSTQPIVERYSGTSEDGSHYWYQEKSSHSDSGYSWEYSYSYSSTSASPEEWDGLMADHNFFDDTELGFWDDVSGLYTTQSVTDQDLADQSFDFVYGTDRPVREAVVYDDAIDLVAETEEPAHLMTETLQPQKEQVITLRLSEDDLETPLDLDAILKMIWGDQVPEFDHISISEVPMSVSEPVGLITSVQPIVTRPTENKPVRLTPAPASPEPVLKPVEAPKPTSVPKEVYPLGISLGENIRQVMSYPVTLQQAQVKAEAMEYLRKLRLDMYQNVNPKFNGQNLRSYLASLGITSAEQYANSFTWDEKLERMAIQRALETGVHKQIAHARTNASQVFSAKDEKSGQGYSGEIIQWGYGMKDSLTKGNAFAYGEVEDLNKANGYSNMANGHLHNLLDPANKAYGFASIVDPDFLYGSVTLGVSSKTASQDTSGGKLNGNYRLAYGIN